MLAGVLLLLALGRAGRRPLHRLILRAGRGSGLTNRPRAVSRVAGLVEWMVTYHGLFSRAPLKRPATSVPYSETMMRFSTQQHRCYCGIDIHARTLALCVLDEAARATVAASPQAVLEALVPYHDGLAVASECMFAWYWLADLCEDQAIPFVPGHALYLKAIHGGKSKNDKLGAA